MVVEDPIANSSKLVFPINTAPLLNNLFVTFDSYVGKKFLRIFDPAVVGMSFVQNKSFIPRGTPLSDNFLSVTFSSSLHLSKTFSSLK